MVPRSALSWPKSAAATRGTRIAADAARAASATFGAGRRVISSHDQRGQDGALELVRGLFVRPMHRDHVKQVALHQRVLDGAGDLGRVAGAVLERVLVAGAQPHRGAQRLWPAGGALVELTVALHARELARGLEGTGELGLGLDLDLEA